MMVDELLTGAALLCGKKKECCGLEYISRSENAPLGWFFWLHEVPGVYEMELRHREENDRQDQGIFYLRYYPDREEAVLEKYSVEEQLLRFDESVFDDSVISGPQEGHTEQELCPCCAVSSHSHGDGHDHGSHQLGEAVITERRKGIPGLRKKFRMHKDLYTIGHLTVTTRPDEYLSAEIRTKEHLRSYAPEGITLEREGERIELVKRGGVNRDVPGRELAERFMQFFVRSFLASVEFGAGNQEDMTTFSAQGDQDSEDVVLIYEPRKMGERRKPA